MKSEAKSFGLHPERLPAHVAIIMDGNGRWAQKRNQNRIKGHEKGADTVRMVVRTSREIGIRFLTLYAFSTENWQRPRTEVSALMMLLRRFLRSELSEMMDNNIRFSVIGEIERLPDTVRVELDRTILKTRENEGMQLTLALSYGGRSEIVRAACSLAADAMAGRISIESIDESFFSRYLYTADMPDPELLIRTSGEFRVSNFLLWQIAYTEMYVTETLWPDFTKDEYFQILKDFQARERRFGKIAPLAKE